MPCYQICYKDNKSVTCYKTWLDRYIQDVT